MIRTTTPLIVAKPPALPRIPEDKEVSQRVNFRMHKTFNRGLKYMAETNLLTRVKRPKPELSEKTQARPIKDLRQKSRMNLAMFMGGIA